MKSAVLFFLIFLGGAFSIAQDVSQPLPTSAGANSLYQVVPLVTSSSDVLDSSVEILSPRGPFFNDSLYQNLWFFIDSKADSAKSGISLESAYRKYGPAAGTPVIVAVIDSGVDYHHEDLKDVLWVNAKEIPDNGIDDDKNGYVDDVYGISTYDRDSAGKATGQVWGVAHHGTHLAGIIGAKQNNGLGTAGVASNVRLMTIKSFPIENGNIVKDVAEALLYAAKNGAKIINCSFSFPIPEGDTTLSDALKMIEKNYDVLIVAAASNSGEDQDLNPDYPASFANKNILTVTNTDEAGELTFISNYGKTSIDIAAPGTMIYGPIMGSAYFAASGTSQATAVASGVAAEVLSRFPHLTSIQLKDILIKSVTKKENLADRLVSGGIIDLLAALDLAKTLK